MNNKNAQQAKEYISGSVNLYPDGLVKHGRAHVLVDCQCAGAAGAGGAGSGRARAFGS